MRLILIDLCCCSTVFTHALLGQVHTRNIQLVDGPTGTRWLLAAHQDTNTVGVYQLDTETGEVIVLTSTLSVGSAGNICVLQL